MRKIKFKRGLIIFLLTILIFTSFGPFIRPKKAQAQFGIEAATHQLIMFIKKSTLSIFKSVMLTVLRNVQIRILTGRSDVPLFPVDIGKYTEDVAIEALRQFVAVWTGYDICGATKAGFTWSALKPEAMPSYKESLIPPCNAYESWKKIKEGKAELTDFIKVSQPNNNFFGVYLIGVTNLREKKRMLSAGIETEIVANQGYLGYKDCSKREAYLKECTTGNWSPEAQQKCIANAPPCETVTVGSTIAKDIDRTKGAPLEQFIAADDWDKTIGLLGPLIADMTVSTLGQKLYQEGVKKFQEIKKQ